MNKKIFSLLLAGAAVVALTGCSSQTSEVNNSKPVAVKPTPAADTAQLKFEESQKLSNDDSVASLEKELNGTQILSEDFSDLK
jgi:hypothetical protein